MKNLTRTAKNLMVLGGTFLVVVIIYGFSTMADTGSQPPTSSNLNTVSMNQTQAQTLINQTEDKTTIPKAVWLAAGMTEAEYKVIWKAGTERPGSSPLNNEKRPGKYITKACGLEVFSADHKFESGTGWPSFYEANKANLVLKDDYSWLGMKRTEVLSTCGEHLGHVFPDGPEPTGLRYCINGDALTFVPETT